jgi:hypothetical protein
MSFYSDSTDRYILDGTVRVLKAASGPCPVCGHPTGNCSGEAAPPQRIIGTETFPSLNYEEVFIVVEDVYEKRWISPYTEATVLVAKAGQKITLQKAQELGLA